MDYPTIADVVAEKQRKLARVMAEGGFEQAGTVLYFPAQDGGDRYLYVEAGDRGMLRIRYITRDYWVTTDGNGGFGQSWCCCSDTPIYRKVNSPKIAGLSDKTVRELGR